MILALTGFMGCGKSSVARELARLLACPVTDLDEAVEKAAGRSIPQIFATDGEAAFRALERQVLASLLSAQGNEGNYRPSAGSNPLSFAPGNEGICRSREGVAPGGRTNSDSQISEVIALGGGTVMTPSSAALLREHTYIVYLRAGIDTLVANLRAEAASRPLLATAADEKSLRERIRSLMEQRRATYESVAHLTVDVDGLSPLAVAQAILVSLA